jgi:hypothetical protein
VNAVLQGARPATGRPRELPDPRARERALHTLRAIRQRYEAGRNAHPEARFYSVQMAVDYGDMSWISAAIQALETSAVVGPTETATAITDT